MDCDKWNHATCEINFGQDKNMKLIAQSEEDKNNRPAGEAVEEDEEDVPYYCLKCRRKKLAKEKAQKK